MHTTTVTKRSDLPPPPWHPVLDCATAATTPARRWPSGSARGQAGLGCGGAGLVECGVLSSFAKGESRPECLVQCGWRGGLSSACARGRNTLSEVWGGGRAMQSCMCRGLGTQTAGVEAGGRHWTASAANHGALSTIHHTHHVAFSHSNLQRISCTTFSPRFSTIVA